MTEPDVVITDYLLAAECAVLAALLAGQSHARPDLQLWFGVFFAGTALAAALGGTVHGFFPSPPSALGRALWRATLLAIGCVAAAGWMIAAGLLWRDVSPGWVPVLVAAQLIGYGVVVLAVSDAFWIAIANYLPSTVLLALAFGLTYYRDPSGAVAVGLAGLFLTLVAAAGQRLQVGVHPVYFNHNALYHLLQGIALAMIFWSARYLLSP